MAILSLSPSPDFFCSVYPKASYYLSSNSLENDDNQRRKLSLSINLSIQYCTSSRATL